VDVRTEFEESLGLEMVVEATLKAFGGYLKDKLLK
jgi:hypothetical protein